jgi:hypothetical protein
VSTTQSQVVSATKGETQTAGVGCAREWVPVPLLKCAHVAKVSSTPAQNLLCMTQLPPQVPRK